MLGRKDMHVYQNHGVQHVIDNPYSGLFLDPGLGKTVTTLTAIDALLDAAKISIVLVIAPLRVARNVWSNEVQEWEHLTHLRVSKILGNEQERIAGLKAKADIYTINRENVAWLVSYLGGAWPFDVVVIDESSSFKNQSSARFKALRRVRPLIKRVVILTGTPIPNGLLDIWPQMYLVDLGERLGKTITSYRDTYFKPGRRNGHVIYEYELGGQKDDGVLGAGIYEKEIYEKIGDVIISMKAEDWLDLPERLDVITDVVLSPKGMEQYLEFEKEQILAFEEEEISAINAAALTNKLLQYANGAVYVDDKKNFIEVHNEKIEALEERIEAANGKPVLCFYTYQSDLVRIQKHLKHLKPYKLEKDSDLVDWNAGKIRFGLGHPASFGHGLNMQKGGHLMEWFGRPWGSELYSQAICRLHRQGQVQRVTNNTLAVRGTLDYDVIDSTNSKLSVQDSLMNAVKARIQKYR